MFRRIVVGADGSPEGKDAVVLGAAIAAATGAGITLLGAFPPLPVADGNDRQRQTRSVDRQLSALRDKFAPSAHVTSVADGNAARALLAEAQSWQANLIVIGSSRHAAMGRCGIGQTGRRLVKKMPAALAIAKRGLHQEDCPLLNIAVGYDGGPESDRALQFADRLAISANAELLIETVVGDPIPPLLPGESRTPGLLDDLIEHAEFDALRIGNRAAAKTKARSYVNGSIGDPGSVLRDISEGVDVMVIGSRRWGLLPRVLLGGVGEALVTDCGSSLIVASKTPEPATPLQERPGADPQAAPTPTPASSETLVQ